MWQGTASNEVRYGVLWWGVVRTGPVWFATGVRSGEPSLGLAGLGGKWRGENWHGRDQRQKCRWSLYFFIADLHDLNASSFA